MKTATLNLFYKISLINTKCTIGLAIETTLQSNFNHVKRVFTTSIGAITVYASFGRFINVISDLKQFVKLVSPLRKGTQFIPFNLTKKSVKCYDFNFGDFYNCNKYILKLSVHFLDQ